MVTYICVRRTKMVKNRKFEVKRLKESKLMIEKCMSEALGLYTAKEPKHGDEWRDTDVRSNFNHLKHELEEIKRSGDSVRQLHNVLDACCQAAILAARIKLSQNVEDKDTGYLLHTPELGREK